MKWLAKTHGRQFELVRHFLARMFDGEWSSTPGQWRSAAVGAMSLVLPAGLLLVREGSLDPKYASKYQLLRAAADPNAIRSAALADEMALITLLSCVTGLIALLVWQSLFPSERDYLVLASLPVRASQVFTARFTSAVLFSGAIVLAMNLVPSLLSPIEFGGEWRLDGTYMKLAGNQAAASCLACFFVFFAILALQGILLNLLPRSQFTRVSVYAQGALAGIFLLGAFYSWSIKEWTPAAIGRLPAFGGWLPPVWFTALHETLAGNGDSPFLKSMSHRALLAAGIAIILAAASYLISYRRYRKLLLESPARLANPRVWRWSVLTLLARSPRQKAVMDFMAKTLLRSRAHRLLWLVYVGAAIAVMVNSSLVDGALFVRSHSFHVALQFVVHFWPLACSVVMLYGCRHVLSIPAELRANWIFQITESQGRAEWMAAVERFVMAYAIAPIYLALFPVSALVLGLPVAIRLTILQLLASLALFEALFYSWQKLPFTCSHIPGERPLVAVIGRYVAMLCVAVPIVSVMTAVASEIAFLFPIYLIILGGLWIWMRQRRREGWGEAKLIYEESPSVVIDLGIKEITYAGTDAELRRTAAGHAGHAHSEDTDSRADARLCGSGVHPADVGGCAAGGGRGALSGTPPLGVAGLAHSGMGRFGEQPPGQVLPDYAGRTQTTRDRGEPLAKNVDGNRTDHGAGIAGGPFGETLTTAWLRLRAIVRRRQLDRDLEDELQFHLAMREEAYMRNGEPCESAGPSARRQFGNVTGIKERCRDLWTFGWFDNLLHDVRYALRQLRRSPGFAIAAAVTLALGIGATTAVYSLLAAILWRPVPLPDPNSLVFVFVAKPGNAGMPYTYAPAGDLSDIRQESAIVDNLAIWTLGRHRLVDAGGEPLVAESARVSPNFFDMLGVRPALGRSFLPGEDQRGHERVVVLSHDLWRRHFAADPGVIGRTIRLESSNFTVVGVMPPEFRFPRSFRELWVPLVLTPESRLSHKDTGLEAGGRLKRGHTLVQAAAELDVIAARLEKRYPETNLKRRFVAMTLSRYSFGDVAPVFAALMLGASAFVLLIACVNVANLLFARATGRSCEVAIRVALGAGRTRLIRQLLTETLVLACAGAALGLIVAKWTLALLKTGIPAEMRHYMPGWAEIGLNAQTFRFTMAAALASGIVAGLAPALRGVRVDLTETLKEGGQGSTAGRGRSRWRAGLLAAEIAMTTLLLVSSVLMVRGFRALAGGGAQLRPAAMLTMRIAVTGERYHEGHQVANFYRELLERAAAIPGVQSAVAATGLPYSRRYPSGRFSIEGREKRSGEEPFAIIEAVTPNYFKTMFVPLRSGRFLSDSDSPRALPVAVISASAAQRWWNGEDPVGKAITLGERGPVSIVGVVGDIPYTAMSRDMSPTIYVPFAQAPDRETDIGLRTAGDPAQLTSAIQAVVRAMDPELPISNLNTMDVLIRQESFGLAMMAGLMGASGLLALVLSVVGVYGVMAYSISGRTHETGIRMALGARRSQVVLMLFRSGVVSAFLGLIIGLIPAWGIARLMQSFIFGVRAADAAAFLGVPLILIVASATAIYLPALRATRIDPVRSLHHE